MTTGEHIGKVLVKIREEEMPNNKRGNYKPPDDFVMTALPKYWCHANRTYIICGAYSIPI